MRSEEAPGKLNRDSARSTRPSLSTPDQFRAHDEHGSDRSQDRTDRVTMGRVLKFLPIDGLARPLSDPSR